ncbi:MAG: MerR family transcriptional regulator [Clostridia bacterium]|nr:MerR family transcriptional regulator [Clostridia bacterium]
MKIKQVCEQTGLTDRAIRYYIEEGLVFPAYTENYMGRRAYDFTEADVAALNHVATLRKFGFTVEEIRRILGNPQESIAVLAEVRARKEETLRQESANLDALSQLDESKAYTVAELAEALIEPVKAAEVPQTDQVFNWKEQLISWLKATPEWVVMLLPMTMVLLIVISAEIDMRYLQYGDFFRILLFFGIPALLPAIVIAVVKLLNRFRFKPVQTKTRVMAVVLCVLYMPVSIFFSAAIGFALYESETDDPAHYLQTDRSFDMPELAWELFPDAPHTTTYTWQEGAYRQQATDVTYHYYYNCDGYHDVYAQWLLNQEELAAEVVRVESLMSGEETYIRGSYGDFEYMAVLGQWYRDGALSTCTPFEEDQQDLTMFAWNAETGEVRYITCDRDNPYYINFEW